MNKSIKTPYGELLLNGWFTSEELQIIEALAKGIIRWLGCDENAQWKHDFAAHSIEGILPSNRLAVAMEAKSWVRSGHRRYFGYAAWNAWAELNGFNVYEVAAMRNARRDEHRSAS